MSDVHFFLPELKKDKKITPPSKAGLWKNDAKAVIRGISDAIELGENAQGVSSIPDIWARPLMFQNFLLSVYKKLDTKLQNKEGLNPLEKRAFQEWKGLLSILALSQTKLSFDKVEIVPFSPNENDRFCKALKMLSPRAVFIEKNKEYSWTDILLIRYNDVPVGAFSPSTLVYTAADYNNDFKRRFISGAGKSSIVLDADGYLCPPTKEKDLLAVGEWVTNIKNKLDALLNTRDESRETDKLIATMNSILLEIWLAEIRSQLKIGEGAIESKEVKVSLEVPYFDDNKVPEFLNNYHIYETLLHPLESDGSFSELSKSDIELKTTRNFLRYNDKEIKHILLVSDKLYSEDYRIWNQLRYTALGNNVTDILNTYFSKPAGQEVRGKEVPFANEGILWIRPESFFITNTLLMGKNESSFLAATEKGMNVDVKYVLPFTRNILDFFSPEEVLEKLKPAYDDKGDRVVFSFTLPVINNDEGLQIKKTFRKRNPDKTEGSILEAEVPVVEIFPDYLGENWRRYFLLQSHADNFSVVPLSNNINGKHSQRRPTIQAGNERTKIKIDELKGSNMFPDGIEINSSKNEPLGLILLDKYLKREKEDTLKSKLEIGIDFGTSNTNVYFKEENAEGKRWCYDFPGYIRQLTASDKNYRNDVLNNSFIPTDEHPLPIPTALLNRYNSQEKPALVLDYFIFFKKKEKDYTIPQNVYTDLKWDQGKGQDLPGQRKDDIDNTDWFIESLLFLIFLEVSKKNCKEVIINCTFPKAFSQDDRTRFGRHWEQALSRLLTTEDRILDPSDDERSSDYNRNKPTIIGPYLLTEGIAAGYFFANPSKFTTTRNIEKAKLADGAICLDVGGGTTDISIWFDSGTKAFYDTSVLLAGRQISEFIRINSDIYNNLFSSNGADALKAKKESDTSFAAVLNMVLKAEEKEVYNNLAKYAGNSSFQSLKRIILLEFGAHVYYTALLCKSAIEKPGGDGLLEKITNRGINLYWGGNGAKFISWLDYGLFNSSSNCVKFLNTIFFYALKLHGINPHSNILQFASPEPKSEACGGIIVSEFSEREMSSSGKPGKPQQQTDSIVSLDINFLEDTSTDNGNSTHTSLPQEFIGGERIELVDNTIIEGYKPVSDKSLFRDNKTIVKDTTLYELELFVKILNQAGLALGLLKEGNQIVLDSNSKAKLKSSISDIFKNMQQKSPDKRRIEPIFIMEVKELMNLILMGLI